LLDHGDSITP